MYDANGTLLYDNTWRSFYVGEPSLVRVGTKEPPKKKVAKKKPAAGEAGLDDTDRRLDDAGNDDAGNHDAGNDDAGNDDARSRRLCRRTLLGPSDRFGEPTRDPGRPHRRGVHDRVERLP